MEDRPAWMPTGVKLMERNGTAAPATARPNPLRRERWVPVGDYWPGHEVLIRFNARAVQVPEGATEIDAIRWQLKAKVRDHRVNLPGQDVTPWIDPDTDQPLPPTSTDGFWDQVGDEIFAAIVVLLAADQKKLKDSIERSSGLSIEALRGTGPTSPSGTPADS